MGAFVFIIYGALFAGLTARHMSYALLALMCMFAYEQWGGINIQFVAMNGSLVNLGILLLVAVSWFRTPTGSFFEFFQYPNRIALFLLLAYAFTSTLWAPIDAKATQRFLDNSHYLFVALLIAPLLVTTAKDFTRVLDAMTAFGGMLVILFAYIPSFEGRGLVIEYDLEATLSLPLGLANFAGTVLVLTVLRMKPRLVPIVWGLMVFGSAVFLLTKTGSRGQLIFSLGALLICLPARWKTFSINKIFIYGLIGLLAVGAFIVVTQTENTLSARMDSSDDATGSRVRMIKILLDAWSTGDSTTLLFGLGHAASWSRELVGFYPHVVPLEILGELGIVGFLLFSWVVVSLFLKAFSGKLKSMVSDQSLIDFCGLFGGFVFALLVSCKQGTLTSATDLLMYAVLAEKCFNLGRQRLRTSGSVKKRQAFSQAYAAN